MVFHFLQPKKNPLISCRYGESRYFILYFKNAVLIPKYVETHKMYFWNLVKDYSNVWFVYCNRNICSCAIRKCIVPYN